jgi:hypothetical protein
MADCVKGRVYKIGCRNLVFGVFDGHEGFIGIRTKFGSRYLATEYHYDQGAPYGTVYSVADTGVDVPEGVEILMSLGVQDADTGRWIEHSEDAINPHRGREGIKKGWWIFKDTGETCGKVHACDVPNDKLFTFLDDFAAARKCSGRHALHGWVVCEFCSGTGYVNKEGS